MEAYTYATAEGSYLALRLVSNKSPSAKTYSKTTPSFETLLDLQQQLIWQLGQWRSLAYTWRHRLNANDVQSYLIVKSSPGNPLPQPDQLLQPLQKLVDVTLVEKREELERILQPPLQSTIVELRQGSISVELAAGEVIGEKLGVTLPLLFQPKAGDWEGFLAGLGRLNAEVVLSTLLIPTKLTEAEHAECRRIAVKADELSSFSRRGRTIYDETAAHAAQVYAHLIEALTPAYFTVLQVASPSAKLAQAVLKRLADTWIQTTTATSIPSGFTLHAPQTNDELEAARRTWTRLKYTRWDASHTAPGLDRLPYLMSAEAASALIRIPTGSIHARIGKGDVILVEDNSKNINIGGGNFNNVNLGINSTFRDITQTVGSLPKADEDTKKQLEQLLKQLENALKQVPPAQSDEVQMVADVTQDLIESANKPEPKKSMLEIKGKNLREAAENLKAVAPIVVEIAAQIVAHVIRFGLGT